MLGLIKTAYSGTASGCQLVQRKFTLEFEWGGGGGVGDDGRRTELVDQCNLVCAVVGDITDSWRQHNLVNYCAVLSKVNFQLYILYPKH